MTSVIFNDPSGSDFRYKFSGVQLNAPSGETLALGANANTADNSNAIVTVGESYIRVPQGVSNERPVPAYNGMIRYTTTGNTIEYYSEFTGLWSGLTPAPSLTSINPSYYNTNTTDSSFITLTGSNFLPISSVQFVGQDFTSYDVNSLNFLGSTTLSALIPSGVITDGSTNEPYSVRVINAPLFSTLTNVFFINDFPIFVDPVSNSILNIPATILDSCQNILGSSTKLLYDLSAVDQEELHYPLNYNSDISSVIGPLLSLDSSGGSASNGGLGVVTGITPIVNYPTLSTTYTFNATATDSLGAITDSTPYRITIQGYNPYTFTSTSNATILTRNFETDKSTITASTNPEFYGYTENQVLTTANLTSGSSTFNPTFNGFVEFLCVAGGGAGGGININGTGCGGGGAGGFITGYYYVTSGSSYAITVGKGGTGVTSTGGDGGNSSVFGFTAVGGGGGGTRNTVGRDGGSGGGSGAEIASGSCLRGQSTTFSQGTCGGTSQNFSQPPYYPGAGGGGAGRTGADGNMDASPASNQPGIGGDGLQTDLSGGVLTYFGGGGGGGIYDVTTSGRPGGDGGGGAGGPGVTSGGSPGTQGTQHYGGGGGGSSHGPSGGSTGANGGAGIVILRHLSFPLNLYEKTVSVGSGLTYQIIYLNSSGSQNSDKSYSGPQPNGYTIYRFTNGTGTITPSATMDCSYVVIGGGGGGGTRLGGGGGAGAFRDGSITLTVSVGVTATVGNGGAGGSSDNSGAKGSNSVLSTITSEGGGYGAGFLQTGGAGSGGSGGGGMDGEGGRSTIGGSATNLLYGNNGGAGTYSSNRYLGGGGGGAGGAGINASVPKAGNGGPGIQNNILGEITGRYYAAGGGGGSYTDNGTTNTPGFGGGLTMTYSTSRTTDTNAGAGDGGNNGYASAAATSGFGSSGFDATPNTGSGGGGGSFFNVEGGKGALGVVIIKFSTF
jgi:hypothetical protein